MATNIIISTIVLRSFPQCNAKEALIPVMSNNDPLAAQHNDHSQMYHSRNIIESQEQTITNTYTSVIDELTTNRTIEQGNRRRHRTTITNLLICLNTYVYS